MRERIVNDRYRLVVPDRIADWDAPSEWERVRFTSMEQTLKPGMTLFDVGAEWGWISVIYARMVGAAHMVLIEPVSQFWPTIRATWEANGLDAPRACWQGLLSDKTTVKLTTVDGWPAPAAELRHAIPYTYIHEEPGAVPQVRLDDWVEAAGIYPHALTIDVEGAELRVLRGAAETLHRYRPLVWCSIHPDLMERDYHDSDEHLHAYMVDAGYRGEHLGTDHEQHWAFTPT